MIDDPTWKGIQVNRRVMKRKAQTGVSLVQSLDSPASGVHFNSRKAVAMTEFDNGEDEMYPS